MSVFAGVLAGALVGGVLLLLSSPLLYRGLKHRSRYTRFRDLATETPASASTGETVLLSGTARVNDGSCVTAPVSGESVLFAAWDIHSLRRYYLAGVRWVWAPEALGIDTEGFEVHDDGHRLVVSDWSRNDRTEGTDRLQLSGTGQMPVTGLDVDDFWVETQEFDAQERILPSEAVPDRLQNLGMRVGFTAERPDRLLPTLPRLRTPEATLRYREITIEDGQSVTILGTVTGERTAGGPRHLVEPDEYPALVSPLDPATVIDRYRRSYWKSVYGLLLVIGLFSSVVGISVAL